MRITQHTLFIYKHLGRLAAKLEEPDLLAVKFKYRMFVVGQPDKRQAVLLPVTAEAPGALRADGDNNSVPLNKLVMVAAQLRQVLLAKRSRQPPV